MKFTLTYDIYKQHTKSRCHSQRGHLIWYTRGCITHLAPQRKSRANAADARIVEGVRVQPPCPPVPKPDDESTRHDTEANLGCGRHRSRTRTGVPNLHSTLIALTRVRRIGRGGRWYSIGHRGAPQSVLLDEHTEEIRHSRAALCARFPRAVHGRLVLRVVARAVAGTTATEREPPKKRPIQRMAII